MMEYTTDQILTAEMTVRNGVKLLDEYRPGWRDRIDISRFDIRSGCDCILGQEFEAEAKAAEEALGDSHASTNGYEQGKIFFGISYYGYGNGGLWSVGNGFLPTSEQPASLLNELWVKEVNR